MKINTIILYTKYYGMPRRKQPIIGIQLSIKSQERILAKTCKVLFIFSSLYFFLFKPFYSSERKRTREMALSSQWGVG